MTPLRCDSRSLLLLVCAIGCAPLALALNPADKISQYVHTVWKSDTGLQSVRRVKQTPDGYLWLATRGGLVRFDGVRFTTYRAGTTPGIESSTMQDLLVDPDGSLWIATLGGGLIHYQQGKFRSYTSRDGLPSDDINSMYRDAKGALWLGSRDGKIARMVNGRIETVSLAIPSNPITGFIEDDDHSLWIAAFGSGVFRLRNGAITGFSVSDGIPDVRVAGLYRDHSGKLWTAGWRGISAWDGTRFVPNPAINAAVEYAIGCMEDRDGNLWVASTTGLLREHSGAATKLDAETGLSGDFAADVFEDREGNLWVGTRGGLDRLRDGPVRTFSSREGLSHNSGPIAANSRGEIWTVSSERISRIAANDVTAWPIPLLKGGTAFSLSSPSGSILWIGFDRGILHWNGEKAEIVPETIGMSVRSLLQARDGSVWIGTANRGLVHWWPPGAGKPPLGAGSVMETILPDIFVTTMAEDSNGVIWAGGNTGGGLYRIAGGQVRQFGRAEGLRSQAIYTLFVDAKNDLWIGSISGLSWFHEGQIKTVSSQQGLPAGQVFAIVDDAYDRLWFAGWGGIAGIEKKSLVEWATGRRTRLTPTVYGPQLFSTGTSVSFPNVVRSADGHLWFSTASGVSEVIPPTPNASRDTPFPVVVEQITVDGVAHLPEDHLRIAPGTRSVEVAYTALALSNPEAVRFRYRLEGLDKNWVEVDSRRTAFFNNLGPGTYTFRVAASPGDEQWREASTLVLEQLPFFYETGWFMALVTISVLSLAVLAYRLRVQQATDRIQAGFQERMDERARIAQELHDTVVQAIAGSTMLVENAAEKVPDSLPVLKGTLLRVADRMEFALAESRSALRGLRDSTKLENDLAKQFSVVAREANQHEATFKLTVTGKLRDLRPMIHYEVFRIGSEAICNAFKHSDATSIQVDLGYIDELRLCVKDNGRGMSADVIASGRDGHFGLQGMRERADRIGAKLDVYSRVGEGTELRLVLSEDLAFEAAGDRPSAFMRAASQILTRQSRNDSDGSRL